MDPTRFDSITKLFASRKTRRAAVGGGLAGAALTGRALAQDATPEPITQTTTIDPNDPHPSADTARADPEFLFVQPFDGGTWAPKAGEEGTYTLTLTGAAANTVYFSDRPERIFGVTPNQQFLDGLGFTPTNPPNAAIVAQREDSDEQEVLVIELYDPRYDADTQTLTYDARVLADYGEHGLAHAARQQQDYELGETFAAGSLFIDDCADGTATCGLLVGFDSDGNDVLRPLGPITMGCCWGDFCEPCDDAGYSSHYGQLCADAYPDTCYFHYIAGSSDTKWNCQVMDLTCPDQVNL